jgi:hypothetical protein
MSGKTYANSYSHPEHGFLDILRWKLGFGPRENLPVTNRKQQPSLPDFVPTDSRRLMQAHPERIQLTWIGHSTFLNPFLGRNSAP